MRQRCSHRRYWPPAAPRDIASNAPGCHEQIEVATSIEPGLDLGNDGRAVFTDRIQREVICIEELADVMDWLATS